MILEPGEECRGCGIQPRERDDGYCGDCAALVDNAPNPDTHCGFCGDRLVKTWLIGCDGKRVPGTTRMDCPGKIGPCRPVPTEGFGGDTGSPGEPVSGKFRGGGE